MANLWTIPTYGESIPDAIRQFGSWQGVGMENVRSNLASRAAAQQYLNSQIAQRDQEAYRRQQIEEQRQLNQEAIAREEQRYQTGRKDTAARDSLTAQLERERIAATTGINASKEASALAQQENAAENLAQPIAETGARWDAAKADYAAKTTARNTVVNHLLTKYDRSLIRFDPAKGQNVFKPIKADDQKARAAADAANAEAAEIFNAHALSEETLDAVTQEFNTHAQKLGNNLTWAKRDGRYVVVNLLGTPGANEHRWIPQAVVGPPRPVPSTLVTTAPPAPPPATPPAGRGVGRAAFGGTGWVYPEGVTPSAAPRVTNQPYSTGGWPFMNSAASPTVAGKVDEAVQYSEDEAPSWEGAQHSPEDAARLAAAKAKMNAARELQDRMLTGPFYSEQKVKAYQDAEAEYDALRAELNAKDRERYNRDLDEFYGAKAATAQARHKAFMEGNAATWPALLASWKSGAPPPAQPPPPPAPSQSAPPPPTEQSANVVPLLTPLGFIPGPAIPPPPAYSDPTVEGDPYWLNLQRTRAEYMRRNHPGVRGYAAIPSDAAPAPEIGAAPVAAAGPEMDQWQRYSGAPTDSETWLDFQTGARIPKPAWSTEGKTDADLAAAGNPQVQWNGPSPVFETQASAYQGMAPPRVRPGSYDYRGPWPAPPVRTLPPPVAAPVTPSVAPPVTVRPQRVPLTREQVRAFIKQAQGDLKVARRLALEAGYTF